jgi:hypothetical protein
VCRNTTASRAARGNRVSAQDGATSSGLRLGGPANEAESDRREECVDS